MMTFVELKDLVMANRSFRRFNEDVAIPRQRLEDLVELCRFTASGRNLQPLRYRIVEAAEERTTLFPTLAWAGYYKDWDGPVPGERPAAYLVQCLDSSLATDILCDDGIQIEAITLGARAMGYGSCVIKAFDAKKLSEILRLPSNMMPRYVIALGVPAEKVVVEDMEMKGDYRYFRDPEGVHHVPKRLLKDLIIG